MSNVFPQMILCRVLHASVSADVSHVQGRTVVTESMSLKLRAEDSTPIQLSTGEQLSRVDIELTLSSRWRRPEELDRDLDENGIGFLAHTVDDASQPAVHGAVMWSGPLPTYLLSPGAERRMRMSVSLPTVTAGQAAHRWGVGRDHILRISNFALAVEQTRDSLGLTPPR